MCGICGYIGESKKPAVSFALITKLFEKVEIRGSDAAGFWGTQKNNGKVIYHKEPIEATKLVKSKVWKSVNDYNPNMLLAHARGASKGVGHPSVNLNNHPFVSTDYRIGMVHNGRIFDNQYETLKKKYEVISSCDSEILLRIFESGESFSKQEIEKNFPDYDLSTAYRLHGLRDIWSYVANAHMAVAIGEMLDNGYRRLWMFRNHHRSLWLVDLREELGQIFFVSTPEIWYSAVYDCSSFKSIVTKKIKLVELPTEEIWMFVISPSKPIVEDDGICKFEVQLKGNYEPWEYKGKEIEVVNKRITANVVTMLDDSEEIAKNAKNKYTKEREPHLLFENDIRNKFLSDVQNRTKTISQLIDDIEVTATNKSGEGSMADGDYEDLLSSLEQTEMDLKGTLRILDT